MLHYRAEVISLLNAILAKAGIEFITNLNIKSRSFFREGPTPPLLDGSVAKFLDRGR